MRAIETRAIQQYHVPRLLLMEHAGLAVAHVVQWLMPPPRRRRVLVCCGGGYNGGDGCVAARHLANAGADVQVWHLGQQETAAPDCVIQLRMLASLGVPIRQGAPPRFASVAADLIVDGLLGMGLREQVREPYARTIAAMNASRRPIVAVDVPSGLDADRGTPCGIAVRARCTVTFGLPKRGLLAAPAQPYVGQLIVDPIGFPAALLARAAVKAWS